MATVFPTALTGGLNIQCSWNAQVTTNLVGLGQPSTNQNSIGKNQTYTFGSGLGQCNELYYSLQSITNGAPVTLDLTNLTEILGQASTTFIKIKQWFFWLLAAGDTAPDGVTVGNACSSIVIGAAAATPFPFSLGGTTPTYTINNGGQWGHTDTTAAGITVSGQNNVKIANNDAGNVAKVIVVFRGTA